MLTIFSWLYCSDILVSGLIEFLKEAKEIYLELNLVNVCRSKMKCALALLVVLFTFSVAQPLDSQPAESQHIIDYVNNAKTTWKVSLHDSSFSFWRNPKTLHSHHPRPPERYLRPPGRYTSMNLLILLSEEHLHFYLFTIKNLLEGIPNLSGI